MVRGPTYDENGIKKGAWSKEEDDKLRTYILKYGHWNWRELPKFAGVCRSGKSCRLRWVNYLKPNLKHGNYTKEEEDIIIKLQEELGNKWSLIASKLPGRTDNEIKNYWHHLKKRKNKDQASIMEEHSNEANQIGEAESQSPSLAETRIQESSPFSTTSDHSVRDDLFGDSSGNFWTDPFVLSDNYSYNQNSYSSSSLTNGEPMLFNDSFYEDSLDLFYQGMKELPESNVDFS